VTPTLPAVRFEGISKSFPGVLALQDVSFEVEAGSCHALLGENGAGKSTLGRILAGIHAPDAGRLLISGQELRFDSPRDARAKGIAIVHQELAFCENLSVAENLCLGSLPARGPFLSRRELLRRAEEKLRLIGAAIDARVAVGALTPGQQQMVQIAAAVSDGARIIVFDEPTSSLSQHEAERLYGLIARLRAQGVTSVYVSHRMEEIFRLCDSLTVLRDGRHVATGKAKALDERRLVQLMIGRPLDEYFPAHVKAPPGEQLLRVSGLTSPGKFHDVSFSLRAGEVLGLAGLVGSGRSEVAQALFGMDASATGEVEILGRRARPRSPREAMRLGLGLLPEDRKRQGLVLQMSALANTTLTILERLSRRGFLDHRKERALGSGFFERLRVRASGADAPAAGLSGGNQQKLVLAKWLAAGSRVLILDEPTRGVDVQAKAEIHALIDELAAAGQGVLLISSELPEVLNLSTRILVLRNGRVAGELSREAASQEAVMGLMAGVAAA
jgi:ABC-type sugar transport system ATPase subunit